MHIVRALISNKGYTPHQIRTELFTIETSTVVKPILGQHSVYCDLVLEYNHQRHLEE